MVDNARLEVRLAKALGGHVTLMPPKGALPLLVKLVVQDIDSEGFAIEGTIKVSYELYADTEDAAVQALLADMVAHGL